ncbi:centrosomal protein of 95 kDa-like isoform X1 [Uloborus diversus]|uniref:centrosomal protein of 95 kDa-like isoform X1 n=1 Tax=Uloborus diversus TaxID=327109 RepID=UPI002409DE71|nr:centrosomal protein of 95 kDa-like isoform X1 [Uloborus diversus]
MAEGYVSHGSNSLEEKCLDLANHLLYVCNIPLPLVESVKDINSSLVVTLFESITNYNIPDFVCSENTVEEAHNVQAVIDTLSLDLLGISLSHITGEDVVSGDLVAIFNLLEIFEGMLLLMPSEDKPVVSDLAESTTISSDRNKSIKKSKPSAFEKSENAFSKPIKLKRYTKCKNKTIISSESLRSSVKYQSFPSASKNLGNNQLQIAHKKSSSAYQKEKIDGLERKKVLDFDKELEAAKENSAFDKLKSRRKFNKIKDCKKSSVHRAESVEDLFESNLEKKVKAFLASKNSPKSRALQMKRNRLKDLKKPLRKPSLTPCRKSFLLPYNLRQRSVSARRRRPVPELPTGILYMHPFSESNSSQKNDAEIKELGSKVRSELDTIPKRVYVSSDNPETAANVKDENPQKTSGATFIKNWMEEFPGLKMPNDVLNRVNKQHEQQVMTMHRKLKDSLQKKTKAYVQAEEAAKKQLLLSNLLKKEIDQYRRLNEAKQLKANENKIKYFLRDARMQSANMKRYCDEFHHEMQRKMQKRNYSEELVAENVFKEVLKIQKDQVQQLCDAVKESDAVDAKHHKNYLEALENLYQTNYAMMTEAVANEKKEMEVETNAMKQVARKRKMELHKNLQREVREMQKNIVEAMADTHFRELDAEQYKCRTREHFSR